MAAGVAHEVRNPLSSVKGLALLLQGKFLEKSGEREAATMLIGEVERMNRAISELLSFSRPAPLETGRVNLTRLIERQIRLLKADAVSDAVIFHLEIAADLLPVVADAERLNQVMFNILLNGIQAMGHGGEMIIKIKAWNDHKSSMVVVAVTDTGYWYG
jgi:two-component system sensor histidine kinase HydH